MSYRGRSKGSYNQRSTSGRTISGVQFNRSSHAKAIDAALKAPFAKTDDQWMDNPSRYDWPNVDTPKPKEVSKPDINDSRFDVKTSKAEEYWRSLTPMERYGVMKQVDYSQVKGESNKYKIIMKFIEDNHLYDKKPPEVKLEPKVVQVEKKPVLIQPEIVKTNSIPESIVSNPSKAKTYAENAQSFEVLEDDYINHRFEREKSRVKANINYFNEKIKEVSSDTRVKEFVRKRKIEELENSIKVQNHRLEMMNNPKPENKASNEHYYRQEYIQLIKDSIKHGKPVPEEVVKQRPEFQVAQDARRRYEKGLHTSFANKSAAINAVMFLEKGYKVKRQDGKEIKDYQINEIAQGIADIQQAVGPTKDIMEKADLTIAHTSGKYPFLMVAGGVYHPIDKTITMGIFGLKSLAHEWAHWLDYEGGSVSKYGYELYSDGRHNKKISSLKTALSNTEGYSNPLYNNAAWAMNDRRALREVYKKAYSKSKDVSPEEKKDAKEMVARVGGYWGDPREVWARLVEQYVAVTHGKKTEAAESPEYYFKHPAYWSKEKFSEYQPQIKAELERRISIARGA